jgi:hypothetical protein
MEIPFVLADISNVNLPHLKERVQYELAKTELDTLFLVAQGDWEGVEHAVTGIYTNRLEEVKNLMPAKIWGKGVINPDYIMESDKRRLEVMKFIVNAGHIFTH